MKTKLLSYLYTYATHKPSEIDREGLQKFLVDKFNITVPHLDSRKVQKKFYEDTITQVKEKKISAKGTEQYHAVRTLKAFNSVMQIGYDYYLEHSHKDNFELNDDMKKHFPTLSAQEFIELFSYEPEDISQFMKVVTKFEKPAFETRTSSVPTQLKNEGYKFTKTRLTDEMISYLLEHKLIELITKSTPTLESTPTSSQPTSDSEEVVGEFE